MNLESCSLMLGSKKIGVYGHERHTEVSAYLICMEQGSGDASPLFRDSIPNGRPDLSMCV